jgi:hypothetical protein
MHTARTIRLLEKDFRQIKEMLLKYLFKKPEYEVAVVVPIYKEALSEYETISLDRCLKILGKHPIVVISPEGLLLDKVDLLKNYQVNIINFPKKYFANIDGYSKLMLSTDFYGTFINYRYVLIYQLDAFVFSDQLLDWCKLSYDYIGAPWIEEDWVHNINQTRLRQLWNFLGIRQKTVGNGGFSLRRVRTFLFTLFIFKHRAYSWHWNEDVFWSLYVADHCPLFKIPDVDLACKFSIETNPAICLMKNKQVLPFGCHAWEKHDINLWREVFAGYGYRI